MQEKAEVQPYKQSSRMHGARRKLFTVFFSNANQTWRENHVHAKYVFPPIYF